MGFNRLIIYRKDIERIMGKSSKSAGRIMQKIKKRYNKNRDQPISLGELCEFLKLNITEVSQFLNRSVQN